MNFQRAGVGLCAAGPGLLNRIEYYFAKGVNDMGTLSPIHWIIVLLVIILLFGAKRIPEIAKGIGQGLREFKKAAKDASNETDTASSASAAASEKAEKKDSA